MMERRASEIGTATASRPAHKPAAFSLDILDDEEEEEEDMVGGTERQMREDDDRVMVEEKKRVEPWHHDCTSSRRQTAGIFTGHS